MVFVGVIATLIVNAWIARSSQRAEIKRQRKTFVVGLAQELEIIRDQFAEVAEELEKDLQRGTVRDTLVKPSHTTVYDANIGDVGLLSPEQAKAVIEAYGLAKELMERVEVKLTIDHKRLDKIGSYTMVPSSEVGALKDLHRSFLPKIDAALAKLR